MCANLTTSAASPAGKNIDCVTWPSLTKCALIWPPLLHHLLVRILMCHLAEFDKMCANLTISPAPPGGKNTVKHLLFAWPYFREAINWDIFTILYFSDLSFLFYDPYIRNYWRGIYFRASLLSRNYAKIKSSRIKSVLQYWLRHLAEFDKMCANLTTSPAPPGCKNREFQKL